MRWILVCMLLVPALLVAGCTQSFTSAKPAITQSVEVITPATPFPTTPGVVAGQMQINMTAEQSGNDVIVQYNGGPDAASLVSLNITIYNDNGQVVTRTMDNPQPGDVYTFPYIGIPDPNNVDVVGTFTGGVQQTVLLKEF